MVEYTTTKLTNNNFQDEDPRISGNNVVWEGNQQIFFYNGNPPLQISSNNNFLHQDPEISGNNIVWEGYASEGWGGKVEAFFYDGVTTLNTESPLYTFNNDPQVSGDNVVWEVDDQILLYNKQTGTTTPLADTSFSNKNPQISGNNVVWVGEERDGDEEIVFYDGTSTVAITDNNFDDDNPRISGNKIVWEGQSQGNDQIYFYNGDTREITQVTNNSFDNEDPRISGSLIVWEAYDGNDEEIFLYNVDTKETIQITNNNSQDQDPEISGKNIVWEGFDDSDKEIFVYDVDTRETTQITNNNIDDEDPQISEKNIVWEADNEIFLAVPTDDPITPPEPPQPPQTIPSVVNLSISPNSGSESGRTTFTITATADKVVSGAQTVSVALTGSASADDFNGSIPTIITIPNGAISGNISLVVTDDNLEEETETATFTISNPSSGITLGSTTSVSATIEASDQIERVDINLGDGGGTNDFSDRTDNLNIIAGSGNDNITSGSGFDKITSGGGDDVINAGSGSNIIDAGPGNDIIVGSGQSGIENQINGGEGIDTVTYNGQFASFPVTKRGDTVQVGSNTDTLTNVETLQFTDQTIQVEDLEEESLQDPLFRFQNSSVPGTYLFAGVGEAENIRNNFSPPFIEEGEAFKVSLEQNDDLVRFNRFQNSSVPGTYLFATEGESVSIRQNFPNFVEEGIAFYAYDSNANIGEDVFRFQNSQRPGTYIFVLAEEAQNIRDNFPNFVEEGIAFEVTL